MFENFKKIETLTMKTTKNKKNGLMTENKSNPKIRDFFKATEKESATHDASDVKSIYRQALKNRVKNFDEETTSLTTKNTTRREADEESVSFLKRTVNDGTTAIGQSTSTSNHSGETTSATGGTVPNNCEECNVWRKKHDELTKSFIKLSVRHSETLMKYDDLRKHFKGGIRASTAEGSDDGPSTAEGSDIRVSTAEESDIRASSAEGSDIRASTAEGSDRMSKSSLTSNTIFTANEILYLESIPLDKKKDSTFLHQCVQYAYKENTASLCAKTLKGTVDRFEIKDGVATVVRPGKDPMTPEKVKRIEELFINRVEKSKCMAGEFGERIHPANINRLIGYAIKNVSNKGKPKQNPAMQNADLNL